MICSKYHNSFHTRKTRTQNPSHYKSQLVQGQSGNKPLPEPMLSQITSNVWWLVITMNGCYFYLKVCYWCGWCWWTIGWNNYGVTWLTAGFRSDLSQYWPRCTFRCISQHWLRKWYGAIRQEATTRANVDQDPCCHMASQCVNNIQTNTIIVPVNGVVTKHLIFSKHVLGSYYVIQHHEKNKYFVQNMDHTSIYC